MATRRVSSLRSRAATAEIEPNPRVDESYFQTLGVPIIAGRVFDNRDGEAQRQAAQAQAQAQAQSQGSLPAPIPGVVIIGKTLADKVFAGRDPVGRRLAYNSFAGQTDLIIGVVGDVKIGGLDEAIRPVIYYPFRRFPGVGTNLVVRTNDDPAALASAIRNETRTLEPEVALFNVRPMGELIGDSPAAFMRRRRLERT